MKLTYLSGTLQSLRELFYMKGQGLFGYTLNIISIDHIIKALAPTCLK